MRDFAAAFAQLPDEQREALVLVGASGFSYEDAARMTCVPAGTVKSRANRARRKLALLLGLDEDDDLPPEQKPPIKRVARRGHRPRMKRRRLRRVIQDLMYLSAKLVRTGRQWRIRLSQWNPWSAVCRALYLRLAPV